MQALEKILEEITDEIRYYKGEYYEETMIYGIESNKDYKAKGIVEGLCKARTIICSHMSDNGWIPAEERLPEVTEGTEDAYCPEFNVTIKGASESTTLKYSWDGTWFDDSGHVYDVIAWRPLPAPYQPEEGGTA